MFSKLVFLCLLGITFAQDYDEYRPPRPAPQRISTSAEPRPTPVPILKQINRHNEDGSYTYGYEGADGSFKIETKLATGEVKGKYGYVDESGKVRVVEYGANKYGFQPSGEGITVAPPTLVDETTNDYDDAPQRPQRPQTQSHQFAPPRPQKQKPQRPPPPPPQPQYVQYEEEDDQPPPPPPPRHHFSNSPTPARAQIPGAAPIDVVYSSRPRPPRPNTDYSQSQTFIPSPPPVREEQRYEDESIGRSFGPPPPRPAPQQITYSQPRAAPVPQQRPQQAAFSAPAPRVQNQPRGGGSILDQLAKDFALPQNGAPALHDITYSYY